MEGIIEEIPPEYTSDDLKDAQSLIGTFTTILASSSGDRNVNVINAASKINGVAIAPGEIFSTNAAFGPSTYENGYRPAPIIVNGKLEDGIGGGMCQVSSTLYDAMLFAELEIVERRNHSLKVGYLDYGFDATLAGDYIGLKFQNSTRLPIILESIIESTKVTINIYGYEEHPPGRKLVFENELIEKVPPGEDEIIEDSALPKGERVVVNAAKTATCFFLHGLPIKAWLLTLNIYM